MRELTDRNRWWMERIPRDGESEAEAIDRLHQSPGYGGSLEDAKAAVWSAMDYARGPGRAILAEESDEK